MVVFNKLPEIIIESPKNFRKTVRRYKEVCPYPKYRVDQGVSSKGDKYTLYANTCTILGMNNGKSTYIGHYAPEYKTPNFKDKLDSVVKNFMDETGQLCAMITGAFHFKVSTVVPNRQIESFEQMVEVAEILDKNNAKLAIIGGKINPVFVDNLAITKNKFILSHSEKFRGGVPTIDLSGKLSQSELEEFLKNQYGIVEFEPLQKISYLG